MFLVFFFKHLKVDVDIIGALFMLLFRAVYFLSAIFVCRAFFDEQAGALLAILQLIDNT